MSSPDATTESMIRNYLAEKKILIADSSAAIRTSISKVMTEMGAKNSNIIAAANYETALSELREKLPEVLILDHNLGGQNGLNLIDDQRMELTHLRDALMVMITGNTSESAIAEAAEDDIDTYVLKPVTIPKIKSYVGAAILKKNSTHKIPTADFRGKNTPLRKELR